jgi:hypothetical protein
LAERLLHLLEGYAARLVLLADDGVMARCHASPSYNRAVARRSLTASLDRIAELAQSLAPALDDRADAGARDR